MPRLLMVGAHRQGCTKRAGASWIMLAVSSLLAMACAASSIAPARDVVVPGEAVEFSFATDGGERFDSKTTRGRATAVLFATTYDLASQVVARTLNDIRRSFVPRINVGAVIVEPPKYALLVEPFRASLGLDYPVALADYETLNGVGPFGDVTFVPTLVVLDPGGHRVWQQRGPADKDAIETALRKALGLRREPSP